MHTYLNAISIYKYDHLHNRETGKRILLKDDVELAIIIQSQQIDLYTADPKNNPEDEGNKPRSIEELKSQVLSENYHKVRKLKDHGDHLYFAIKACKKRKNGGRPYECCFQVKLLEELYMVWKSPKQEDGESYHKDYRSCSCVVNELVYGEHNKKYFKPIYGSCLSDFYTITYEMYFDRYGRSSSNIYKHLTLNPSDKSQPFMRIRRRNSSNNINFT